ncbi:MAG: hypothetical protein HFE85_02850 [Clostridiales bacterium]|nr:hypothetical protein [Clostridiales bacterium]
MEAIGQIVLLILVLLGLVYLMRLLMMKLLSPGQENDFLVLVPVYGHREDVELMLRSAAARARWFGKRRMIVTVLDCGMDEETENLCRRLCRELRCAQIVSREELEKQLETGMCIYK